MKHFIFTVFFIASCTLIIPHTAFCDSLPKTSVAITPERLLPKGVDAAEIANPFTKEKGFVRKGTIASFLINIALVDSLMDLPETADTQVQLDELSAALLKSIPSVKIIGLFDLFSPKEWTDSKHFSGRLLAITYYYKTYPDMITKEIRDMLAHYLKTITSPHLKKAILSLLSS